MPNRIVDRFNVDGQDYAIEPVIDPTPVEGSQHAVMSGGVYTSLADLEAELNANVQRIDNDKSNVPVQNSTANFTAGGAYDFFAGATTLSQWKAVLFGRFLCRKWEAPESGVPNFSRFSAIILEYGNGLWIWVGYHSDLSSDDYDTRISTDGKNWVTPSAQSSNMPNFRALKFVNGLWVGGTSSGCWWSEDGINWTQSEDITVGVGVIYYIEATGLWICGGFTEGGAWWSEDGKNWTQCNGIDITSGIRNLVGNGETLVCGMFESGKGAWWSQDGGKSWAQISGSSGQSVRYTAAYTANSGNEYFLVACRTSSNNLLLKGGLSSSVVPRFMWTTVSGMPSAAVSGMDVKPVNGASSGGDVWLIGTGSGLYQTNLSPSDSSAYSNGSVTEAVINVKHIDGVTLIQCQNGKLFYISDGSSADSGGTFIKQLPTLASISDNIVFANGLWVSSVIGGEVCYSADGITWLIAGNRAAGKAVYANGMWVTSSMLRFSSIDSLPIA